MVRLQDLQAAGDNESAEADAIRDEMDGPWAAMSPAEQELVDGLSADLYMLSGEEVREPGDSLDAAATLDERRSSLYVARRWVDFVKLLRRGPTDLGQSSLAYLRFRAYEGVGLQSAAGRFIERAVELAPRDTLKMLAIVHAQMSGDVKSSVRRANAALETAVASPGLIIVAAGAVLASTRGIPADLAVPQWHRVIEAADRAIASPSVADDEQVYGLIFQGLAFEFLGEGSAARAAYGRAAAIAPFDPLVRHARAGQPADADRNSPPANVTARLRIIELPMRQIGGPVAV